MKRIGSRGNTVEDKFAVGVETEHKTVRGTLGLYTFPPGC